MLDLDITVIYTIVILWILLIILNKIFYKPVGNIIADREKKEKTELSEIERMRSDIDERSARVEITLKKARKESNSISEGIIREGEKARDELVLSTREKSSAEFRIKMDELDKEIADAEVKLKGEIKSFSKKIEEIFT